MNIDFCDKYDMLPHGAVVLCAVSGGKDSMYLLEKLLALAPDRCLDVRCAHFNHRLRGIAANRDQDFVQDYCAGKGVACYIGSGEVARYARENGFGTEEAARIMRYEFLEKTAAEIGATRIATAHTADDNAETMLFNLARGCGLKGLSGIPPVRGRIVRPILTVTSAEVLHFLSQNGIPHVEDETNRSDSYTRNRIRHKIVPELRTVNAGFDQNVCRTAELLREDEELLSSMAQSFADENYKNNSLPAGEFSKLPYPISARVLQSIVTCGISARHVDAVRALASSDKPHGFADLPQMRVAREYDRLVFGVHTQETLSPLVVRVGETMLISEAGLEISCQFIDNCTEIHNSFKTFFFKSDTICGNITVGSRKNGGKIRLGGRACTKTLKKLFSESRLNGLQKELVPVLYDDAGPIAVYGFGIAERCLPQSGDSVIKIEIKPRECRKA